MGIGGKSLQNSCFGKLTWLQNCMSVSDDHGLLGEPYSEIFSTFQWENQIEILTGLPLSLPFFGSQNLISLAQ